MLFVALVVFLFAFGGGSAGDCVTGQSKATAVVSLLDSAKILIDDAKKLSQTKSGSLDEICSCDRPTDCADIYEKDSKSKSGVYKVWPKSRVVSSPVEVYCDMDDDGGAWTVLQRRGDYDSEKSYFYRDWESYKRGFGDLQKDFWLGNDNIYALTNQRRCTLKFDLADWERNRTYAFYDEFYIDDEPRKYAVHVKGYRGKSGDSFSNTDGVAFSTKDQDNDTWEKHCAQQFKGAWWYTSCHSSNLNGDYLKGAHESHANGVNWQSFRGYNYSLKDTAIKIRPIDFKRIDVGEVTPE